MIMIYYDFLVQKGDFKWKKNYTILYLQNRFLSYALVKRHTFNLKEIE